MGSALHGVSLPSTSLLGLRPTSKMVEQHAGVAREKSVSYQHQQTNRNPSGEDTTLADVVNSLARRGSDDLTTSRVSDTDYATLFEWIRCERMRKLPPEGSGYDKALVWAALFIERVHSFDLAIEQFAGDSHLAAQLSYGYCASLLEVSRSHNPKPIVVLTDRKRVVGRGKCPCPYGPIWIFLPLLFWSRQPSRSCRALCGLFRYQGPAHSCVSRSGHSRRLCGYALSSVAPCLGIGVN